MNTDYLWLAGLAFSIVMWAVTFVGSAVSLILISINFGQGDNQWEKEFWRGVCKEQIRNFAIFAPLFILSNYLIYMLITY